MFTNSAQFSYRFDAAVSTSQVLITITSTSNTSLVWVLGTADSVKNTAVGVSGTIRMNPRNVLDTTPCPSPTYSCITNVVSAPATYTATDGTVFLPNGSYTTQMSYVDTNNVKYSSAASSLNQTTMTPPATITAAFGTSKLKNRITMNVPITPNVQVGYKPTLTVTGNDSCSLSSSVVTFANFSANTDIWGEFLFSSTDGSAVSFTSSVASTTSGLETLRSGCIYTATFRWISSIRLPPYPTDPSYPTWASSKVQFTAPAKPSVANNPTVTKVDATSFKASWEPPISDGLTPLTYSWVRATGTAGYDTSQVCATTTECTLRFLPTDDMYTISIALMNDMGQSSWLPAGSITLSHCDYPSGASTDWSGCDKSSSDFSGINFSSSNFANTNFSGSNFTGASLSGTNISGADFSRATFSGTTGTQITGADTATLPSNWAVSGGTLGTLPAAPLNVSQVRGDHRVTLRWDAPTSNGGIDITGYEIYEGSSAVSCTTVGQNSCTITDLAQGDLHTYAVRARNPAGLGAASSSSPIEVIAVPDSPQNTFVTESDRTLTVTWAAPINSGGASITEYKATVTPGNFVCTTSTFRCVFSELSNGAAYTVSVQASNEAGIGTTATVINKVPFARPDAPTQVLAIPGARSANVSWSAPASNGREITRYTAYSVPSKGTCSSVTTSCVMTGLIPDVDYTFKVVAANIAGGSPESENSLPVRILNFAKVPTNFKVTPAKGAATFSWTKSAANGGSPILNYTVTVTPGDKTCVATTRMTCTIRGLKPKSKYIARVAVATALGQATSTIRLQFIGK